PCVVESVEIDGSDMEGNKRREGISTLFHVARWRERDGGCHLRTRRAGKPPVASSPDTTTEIDLSHRSTSTKIIPITRVVCDIDVTKLKIESCQEFPGSTIKETQRHDNGVIRKDAQRVQANRNSLESSLEPCSRRGRLRACGLAWGRYRTHQRIHRIVLSDLCGGNSKDLSCVGAYEPCVNAQALSKISDRARSDGVNAKQFSQLLRGGLV